MLHISKLKDFKVFLVNKGYSIMETSNNPYEVLRAKKGKDTVIIYKKANTKEHLTVMEKDAALINEFRSKIMGKNKIQSMLNKIDEAKCDPDCDMLELKEYYAELGKEVYRKSLQKDECEIRIKNPRKYRNFELET